MPHRNHNYYVYLLSNKYNNVIYTGVTNNLSVRVYRHKSKKTPGFTSRYKVTKLVYYEYFEHIERAIDREKQIKAGSRKKKEELIKSTNPDWKDLFDKIKD